MSTSIIDPFHRKIYDRLSADIDNRMVALSGGSATKTQDDQVSTAEKYAAQCMYLQALNDVLKMCVEIEADHYGARPGEDGSKE